MCDSSEASIVYRPLKGFHPVRLIRLLAGQEDDHICIEFIYQDLAWAPDAEAYESYEALSYTWGNANPLKMIQCNGIAFEIRANAHDFLQRLRDPSKSRIVWMDCICINQQDIREREEQVKIMSEIYLNARCVRIWLGPEARDSALAMEFVASLDVNKYMKEQAEIYFNYDLFPKKSFLFDDIEESPKNKRLAKALISLLQRPWLRRIWIQQEAVLCADTSVLCGKAVISWDHFVSLVWLLTPRNYASWPDWIEDPVATIIPSLNATRNIQINRMNFFRIAGPHSSDAYLVRNFCALLKDCSQCEATDPRDKVYALYSLFSGRRMDEYIRRDKIHQADSLPLVDYTISWQVLYVRVAKWLYSSTFNGERPDPIGRSMQNGIELPSWVPDFRRAIGDVYSPHTSWAAGGKTPSPNVRFMDVPKAKKNEEKPIPMYYHVNGKGRHQRITNVGMEVTCLMMDAIIYKGSSPDLDSGSRQEQVERIRLCIMETLAYLRASYGTYFTGDPSEEAFSGTIIANTTHDDELATKRYEFEGFTAFKAWMESNGTLDDTEYGRAVESAGFFFNRPFCATAHGLFSLIPRIAEVGDYVAILAGFRLPVVLRRVGAPAQRCYELLGSCYIHRLMRGRIWSLMEEFGSKYHPGSEDETIEASQQPCRARNWKDIEGERLPSFPYNAQEDYKGVLAVLGKRRVILV